MLININIYVNKLLLRLPHFFHNVEQWREKYLSKILF